MVVNVKSFAELAVCDVRCCLLWCAGVLVCSWLYVGHWSKVYAGSLKLCVRALSRSFRWRLWTFSMPKRSDWLFIYLSPFQMWCLFNCDNCSCFFLLPSLHCLASGEGIVVVGVHVWVCGCVCVCVCVCHAATMPSRNCSPHSVGSEGNALYSVLSSSSYVLHLLASPALSKRRYCVARCHAVPLCVCPPSGEG